MTENEVAKVIELYQTGLSYRRVAAELGLLDGEVANVLKRTGSFRKKEKSSVREHAEKIKQLYLEGFTSREVAQQLGFDYGIVGQIVREAGISRPQSEYAPKTRERKLSESMRKMTERGQASVERLRQKELDRLAKREARALMPRKKSQPRPGWQRPLSSKISSMVSLARRRAFEKGWAFDLTPKILGEIYRQQGGLCRYTHLPMSAQTGPMTVSLDRIDPLGGYTKDNVQLTCWFINQMRRDLTEAEFLQACRLVTENAHLSPQPLAVGVDHPTFDPPASSVRREQETL